jgi:hypothetical protein
MRLPALLLIALLPGAGNTAERFCDQSETRATPSPDGQWVANVQEEVCDTGNGPRQASRWSSLPWKTPPGAGACSRCRCHARATTGHASAGWVRMPSNCGLRIFRKRVRQNRFSRASAFRWSIATTIRQTARGWPHTRHPCCNGRKMSPRGPRSASRIPMQRARDRRGQKNPGFRQGAARTD